MPHPRFDVPTPVGQLSVMACPPSEDLRAVLKSLSDAGVGTVVCLLADEEAAALGVDAEASLCTTFGLHFIGYPIVDFGLPDLDAFQGLIAEIAARLRADAHVVVHCKAGIGRSGMVAACTLVLLGATPAAAQATVSAARGVTTPDTAEQGDFIAFFAQNRPQ